MKICSICEEEFELKPDKPGFANRCPECSSPETGEEASTAAPTDALERKVLAEGNEERRKAMRDLLYRRDS